MSIVSPFAGSARDKITNNCKTANSLATADEFHSGGLILHQDLLILDGVPTFW